LPTIAIVQMAVIDGEIDKNLNKVERLFSAYPGADIYLLPELFTTGYDKHSWRSSGDFHYDVAVRIGVLAKRINAVVCGSLAIKDGDNLYNRMLAIGPDGTELARYDKIHLFKLMQEDKYFTPGRNLGVFEFRGARFGMAICYDLRFPAMFQKMAADGVHAFLVSSEWPHPRCDIIELLARARAVENQCFLASSNRVGISADGTEFCGGSLVTGPGGRLRSMDETEEEGILLADISAGKIQSIRKTIDVLSDRVSCIDLTA